MLGEVNMPENLWFGAYDYVCYAANRILIKKYGWKILFKLFIGRVSVITYIYIFSYKAYVVNHKILKLYKMVLRMIIGYFYGIVLIRIFKIFILIRRRVIYSKDVRFDDTKVYHPIDLDIGAIYTRDISEIIKLLDLPDEITDR